MAPRARSLLSAILGRDAINLMQLHPSCLRDQTAAPEIDLRRKKLNENSIRRVRDESPAANIDCFARNQLKQARESNCSSL